MKSLKNRGKIAEFTTSSCPFSGPRHPSSSAPAGLRPEPLGGDLWRRVTTGIGKVTAFAFKLLVKTCENLGFLKIFLHTKPFKFEVVNSGYIPVSKKRENYIQMIQTYRGVNSPCLDPFPTAPPSVGVSVGRSWEPPAPLKPWKFYSSRKWVYNQMYEQLGGPPILKHLIKNLMACRDFPTGSHGFHQSGGGLLQPFPEKNKLGNHPSFLCI